QLVGGQRGLAGGLVGGHRTGPLAVRRARQGDGGEGRRVDRFEGPALGGGEVQGGGQPRQLLGVGQRPADRVAHVRRAGLGDGGAVDQGGHRVDDGLRV